MRVAWIALIAGCGFRSPDTVEGSGPPDIPDAGDAGPVMSGGFDPGQCPADYATGLLGASRYRLIIEGHPAWTQSDDCADDLRGATHLVVLDSPDELAQVGALVAAPPMGIAGSAVWVGVVQPRTAATPAEGWLRFDGTPVSFGWGGGEPNDKGGDERQHDEQFARITSTRASLADDAGTDSLGALCECDGKPIAQSALDAIAANRPPG